MQRNRVNLRARGIINIALRAKKFMFENIPDLIDYHDNSPAPLHFLESNGYRLKASSTIVPDIHYLGAEVTELPLEVDRGCHLSQFVYWGMGEF